MEMKTITYQSGAHGMLWTTEAEREDVDAIDLACHPFWKMFPPHDVNKPPDEINGTMYVQMLVHAMGLHSD
jgi:hypothetical protein